MDRTPLVARVFLLGFRMYLILAQTDQVYLILAFALLFTLHGIILLFWTKAVVTRVFLPSSPPPPRYYSPSFVYRPYVGSIQHSHCSSKKHRILPMLASSETQQDVRLTHTHEKKKINPLFSTALFFCSFILFRFFHPQLYYIILIYYISTIFALVIALPPSTGDHSKYR